MDEERRSERNQVPDRLDGILNEAQLMALNTMEGFGWSLAFIRKPLFQDVVPVLLHSDNRKLGTLGGDGVLNVEPDVQFR